MNLSKNIFIKNSSIYFAVNIFIVLCQLLLLPFYTSYLSPEDWGYIALFLLFGPTLVALFSFGLPRASYYFYFKIDNKNDFNQLQSTNFFTMVITNILIGTLVFKYSSNISSILFNDHLSSSIIRLSFVSGFFQFLTQYIENIITCQERAFAHSTIVVSRFIIASILSILLIVFYSMTHMARINGILFSNLFSFLLSLYLFKSHFTLSYSINKLKKSIKFSYPELPLTLISIIISSFDKLFLTNIRGLKSLGYYTFGSKFVDLLRELPNAVRRSWNPFYFNTVNENTISAKKLIINRFEQIFFILSIPCVIVLLFSEEIILIFGNVNYNFSMFIIPIYAFTYFISIIDFLSSNQITSSEKLIYQMPSAIVGGIANLGLNYVLIIKFGAIGAAFAASLYFAIGQAINLYFGNKLFPLPINIKKIILFFSILIMISYFSYILIGVEIDIVRKIFIKIATIAMFIPIVLRFSNLNFKSIKDLV